MDGEVPNPQYCTNVLLMLRGQHVIVVFYLPFFRTGYQFVLWYCHSKENAYCIKLVVWKEKKWLFHFAFLYKYFVPKVLFTHVNNSVNSAICLESKALFLRSLLVLICTCWSQKARSCSIACINLSLLPCKSHQSSSMSTSADRFFCSLSYLKDNPGPRSVLGLRDAGCGPAPLSSVPALGYLNFLPEEGAVVSCSHVASHQ